MKDYREASTAPRRRVSIVRRLVLLALLAVPAVAAVTVDSQWWQHRVEPTYRLFVDPDPRVLYAGGDDASRRVALTIDDGPDAETTDRILDVLDRHDASATFFLISGRVAGNEAVVERIVAEGHEIGNHMTADRPAIDLEPAGFDRDLKQAHDTLSRWQELKWFRPGSGWYDDGMIEAAERRGYRTVLGRIYPLDTALPSPALAARYILWRAGPGEIIILHDTGSRGLNTARILERVLPELERRGLEVVALSELERQEG